MAVFERFPISHADAERSMQKLDLTEESQAAQVAERLGDFIFGQDEACNALARHVVIYAAGIPREQQPASISFHLGPTGTGKTEIARVLSREIFGDTEEERLLIIDCADFTETHT